MFNFWVNHILWVERSQLQEKQYLKNISNDRNQQYLAEYFNVVYLIGISGIFLLLFFHRFCKCVDDMQAKA